MPFPESMLPEGEEILMSDYEEEDDDDPEHSGFEQVSK
jgi:hypothetical protein